MRSIVAIIVVLCLLGGAAVADDARILPKGTSVVVKHPSETAPHEFVIRDQTHFIISRMQLDKANAVASASKKLQQSLVDCQKDLVAERNKDRGRTWVSAVKWTSIGLVIAGAFYLGTRVR